MFTQDEIKEISLALIAELEKRRAEKEVSASQWGKAAFPDSKGSGAQAKIQRYRENNFSDLSMSDFIRMAKALDVDPAKLFSAILYEKKF